jgi:RNA methyltransferase, TrmH family
MISKSQVKYIQSLDQKKFRDEAGEFIAEGPKIINELLLEGSLQPSILYATEDWMQEAAALIKRIPAERLVVVSEQELDRVSFLSSPNRVAAIFSKPVFAEKVSLKNCLTLVLDGIQDPGNMGTIIRTADWFGINYIICSPDCADAFSPKVVQSSMGSIARVQLRYTALTAFLQDEKEYTAYAATLGGDPLHSIKPFKEGLLVIGNESKGISRDVLQLCSRQITIEKQGKAESLNAAVATGILLSHITG